MSWMKKTKDEAMPNAEMVPEIDPAVEQALAHFRASVHAWSEAALSRPRRPVQVAAHGGWRLAAGWALGCVFVVGGLSGGLFEHHHREVQARVKAEQEATQRQLAAQQQRASISNEDLLATVDSDISRDVPAAMEPLERLMDDGSGQ
jgi:hypothetical protein